MWPGWSRPPHPPRHEAAPGLQACENGSASLAEMRAAASARVAGKAEQRLDWAISKVPGSFLTSWGSSLPSALLTGGRAGAGGAWHRDPGLSEPGESALQDCGGGGAAAAAACSPIPSGGEHTQAFSPALRLLGV